MAEPGLHPRSVDSSSLHRIPLSSARICLTFLGQIPPCPISKKFHQKELLTTWHSPLTTLSFSPFAPVTQEIRANPIFRCCGSSDSDVWVSDSSYEHSLEVLLELMLGNSLTSPRFDLCDLFQRSLCFFSLLHESCNRLWPETIKFWAEFEGTERGWGSPRKSETQIVPGFSSRRGKLSAKIKSLSNGWV